MLKKNVIVIVGTVGIIISGVSQAASFASWEKAIMPIKHHINYRHPYIKFDVSGYKLKIPQIKLGTTKDLSNSLVTINDSKIMRGFNSAIGYAFYNQKSNVLTKLFGHDNAVELQLSYYNSTNNKNRMGNIGNGLIWWIDGRGTFIPPTVNTPMRNLILDDTYQHINTGLYYRGGFPIDNGRISFMPRVGIVFNNSNERYGYRVQYNSGSGNWRTDKETYKVNTNYYGIATGSKLDYKIKQRISVFMDWEMQLLYAKSKLNAHQNTMAESDSKDFNIANVHCKNSNINYRTTFAVGTQ